MSAGWPSRSAVWNSTSPLKPHELDQVRMHPYYTNQVLSRTPFLRSLAEVASCHHERLDGSGYFRGSRASALSAPARILAAADMYQTKTERRPYRDALDADEAAAQLRAEVEAGRLDQLAVDAVLAAAGRPSPDQFSADTSRDRDPRGGGPRRVDAGDRARPDDLAEDRRRAPPTDLPEDGKQDT